MTASALATAGGVVFGGTSDCYLFALNSDNGKLLWQTRLNGDIPGAPISFEVGSHRCIAVGSGGRFPFHSLAAMPQSPPRHFFRLQA